MQISEIRFSAGRDEAAPPLKFTPGRTNIFIGPNNGGKSLSLRDIQRFFRPNDGRPFGSHVLTGISLSEITDEEIDQKLEFMKSKRRLDEAYAEGSAVFQYRGFREAADENQLRSSLKSLENAESREYVSRFILQHYVLNLGGAERLQLAGAGAAQTVLEKPVSTQAALFYDDERLKKLSKIVHDKFGKFLIINPVNLHSFSYALADKDCPDELRRSLSREAIEFFNETIAVESLSDGTRAFIGMLAELVSGRQDILFLDEPEAFLHPTLAYSLGREMVSNIAHDRQIFVATHSPHFLLGCLSAGGDVSIVRLTYDFGRPTARLLSNDSIGVFTKDPLMRSVGMASALFYSGVVLVEGDSDRIFYEEVNNLLLASSRGIDHALIINAQNKQTASMACSPLRSIGIPVAMVLDIDWVKEDGLVAKRYLSAAGVPEILMDGILSQRRSVRKALEAVDERYKRAGGISCLDADARKAAEAFFTSLEVYGLFTIQGGELESWLELENLPREKSNWISEALTLVQERYIDGGVTPGNDDVWAFIDRVARWIKDETRLGM